MSGWEATMRFAAGATLLALGTSGPGGGMGTGREDVSEDRTARAVPSVQRAAEHGVAGAPLADVATDAAVPSQPACAFFGPEQCGPPAELDEQRVMGAYALKEPRYFKIRLDGVPQWGQFEQRRDGFRVNLFGAQAQGKAAKIAQQHPAVRYAAVYDARDCLGRGRCLRFEVKFEPGRATGYRVYWVGESLWLELGELAE